MRRVEAESRRHRRNEVARVWADAQLERALVVLAARWPARFGETLERVRSSNRMFAELRAIRRGNDVDQVAEEVVLHEPSPSDGPDGPTGDGRWQR